MTQHLRLVSPPDPAEELDALQDQVLEQLELLNQRIEAVIKEFAPQAQLASAPADGTSHSGKSKQDDKAAA